MERISAANTSVGILQAREDLLNSNYYKSLQRLVRVLRNMKKFIEDITQYNTVQKFLGAKKIESEFKELCKEYDSSMTSLNFNLLVVNFNTETEDKIVKEDVEQLIKFQEALVESMNNVEQKVSHTNDQMNLVVERVSEMAITMQNMQSMMGSKKEDADQIQNKIDIIFRTDKLPFDDYEEADENSIRSERLRKYTHVKTKEEFAFKVVDQDHINDVKNQVTILMKLKDCQNIINFYGLTSDTSNGIKTYLVTEWAEKGNLREYILDYKQDLDLKLKIRIAYDIAKGLNFLNSVKMVHRDIRSENIVITDHEIAKITNFKFSRRFDEATSNIAVNKECVRYSAPEMLRRGISGEKEKKDKYSIKYDTKCEVYSFGILLWEIAERKIPYEQFEDFMEVTRKVVGGYRESFTTGTDIPKKYQDLVNKSVDPNPGSRPIFSRMLTVLQDIFRNPEEPTSRHNSIKAIKAPPERKMTQSTIAAAEDCIIDWDSFDYMTLDKAIEYHKNDSKDKQKLYKCFDTYAEMDNPRAKYWKAYYISKGWSDLKCSDKEKQELSVQLFKEAADYGDEIPDAQLRYATMVMQGKGVKQDKGEAIKYFLKAAKNGHLVAMFNIATFYYSNNEKELGNYYMISAANKDYLQAINYCKKNNISY
ncbi:kinase-like domain-containing protein [Rhizophagus irregularis DAOM 181602=DAOM 197198]|uniref:Kinase-like domain-containing protein n=1 Tax=Rhizophagus irregularis (strain DAOM 181602 / DAOM 197198 / MUCL 43194) TaxID=747089 RepID=A0A2P4QAS6_RHIID|nr:kinase-like domain-containing protein [Rhizophagus irregularis DAOM 181602=DAOM 197198]POG74739.1 kinase-like domain-containing protein [Rhizophagus irregularis DAOM 181602=DAOM 197198]|eukprot:XP_025181605.1 kinase-like domain-containing protein [Rhizophagus irregularis DAOM 181602=DAOM 197198]